MDTPNDAVEEKLAALRDLAQERRVPIVRPQTAALIRVWVSYTAAHNPSPRILELGTAIGYSAILMAQCAPGARIDTVEINPDAVTEARAHIRQCGMQARIRVIAGDALEVLPALPGPYDFIFLDCAKGQYVHLYDDLLRLLAPGATLLCDDCTFYGKTAQTPEETAHKHRTIVANLRAFGARAAADPRLRTALLPMEDGVLVAVRLPDRQEDR